VGNRMPEALKGQRVFFMVSRGVRDKSTAKTCSQIGESQGWQEQTVDVKFEAYGVQPRFVMRHHTEEWSKAVTCTVSVQSRQAQKTIGLRAN
jgi:hypothetical protein